jgi:hypothetical protein
MTTKKVTAVGRSWYVKVGGERLPCLQHCPTDPVGGIRPGKGRLRYVDPEFDPASPRWIQFLVDLKTAKKAVVALCAGSAGAWKREGGYVGLFDVDGVEAPATGLELDLVKRHPVRLV